MLGGLSYAVLEELGRVWESSVEFGSVERVACEI